MLPCGRLWTDERLRQRARAARHSIGRARSGLGGSLLQARLSHGQPGPRVEQPVGTDIWVALAWCVGVLVVAYALAMVTYRRKIS